MRSESGLLALLSVEAYLPHCLYLPIFTAVDSSIPYAATLNPWGMYVKKEVFTMLGAA